MREVQSAAVPPAKATYSRSLDLILGSDKGVG
jgi:hypothetical protein